MYRLISSLVAAVVLTLVALAPKVDAGTTHSQLNTCTNLYSTQTFYRTFEADEWAQIVAAGDGDTDVDLYVYDAWGNLVASDTDGTDYCVVSWVPDYRQQYRIVIRNFGSVYNRVCISSN